ncbi:carbohydrate ABC transporter permease [Paenibacillus silviterrae]|uniref:carbohydrate ABC transporter permease n=1 Tax=Paenibacillus silviterrae TaxID=3242194 RepID=UPI002543247C|nr:sugar ABC transporter permease [Paenibacillus chinjuensis]
MIAEKGGWAKLRSRLLFTGPTLFAFITVVIIPFLYGIYLTFTNWDGISTTQTFVAFDNYAAVFKDIQFWQAFGLTLKYVFSSVVLINAVAFAFAYALTSGIKGSSLFRAGFFLPNLVGGIVLGFIWQFVFNHALVKMGQGLALPLLQGSWLAQPDKAMWALVLVTVWQYAGYMMVIYIAGLMNVPRDILEAAGIDGATGWTKLRSMVLPLMVPSFIVCIFLSLQRGFMVYDLNLSLTKGGPFNSTKLVSMHVYEKAFLSRDYGVGQAEAFVLFLMVAAITLLQVYFSKKLEVEA